MTKASDLIKAPQMVLARVLHYHFFKNFSKIICLNIQSAPVTVPIYIYI